MKASLFALFGSIALPVAVAGPMGASLCVGGQPSVGGGHLSAGHVTGPLSDYGLEVHVDGEPIDFSAPLTYGVGVEHRFELVSTTGKPFKGFLLRFAPAFADADIATARSSAVDLSESVSIPSNYSGLMQVSDKCASPSYGITHTSRDYKTMVPVYFASETPVPMSLDVTVVVKANATGSEFYYSGFALLPPQAENAVSLAEQDMRETNTSSGAMNETYDEHDSHGHDHEDHDSHDMDYNSASATYNFVAGAAFVVVSVVAVML